MKFAPTRFHQQVVSGRDARVSDLRFPSLLTVQTSGHPIELQPPSAVYSGVCVVRVGSFGFDPRARRD